jgi:hypothetical protein
MVGLCLQHATRQLCHEYTAQVAENVGQNEPGKDELIGGSEKKRKKTMAR